MEDEQKTFDRLRAKFPAGDDSGADGNYERTKHLGKEMASKQPAKVARGSRDHDLRRQPKTNNGSSLHASNESLVESVMSGQLYVRYSSIRIRLLANF